MELLSSLSPDREGEGGGVFTPVSHALFVLYITFIHMAITAPHKTLVQVNFVPQTSSPITKGSSNPCATVKNRTKNLRLRLLSSYRKEGAKASAFVIL
jgi:hypothetical protein